MNETAANTVQAMSLDNMTIYTEQLRAKYVRKKDLPTKVSELTNDVKYQTEEQVAAAISAKVSSTYRAGGSVAFEALPELTETNLGIVVNVTDSFVTTESFLEGAGARHPAGTNIVVAQSGEEYKYDVLAGFVDLSGFASTESVDTARTAAVTQANADTDAKLTGYVKTSDIKEITEADILAMFAED